MPETTALVSAYRCKDFIGARIENLLSQSSRPHIIIICQENSIEHQLVKCYGLQMILTPNIPTLYTAWNMGVKAAKTPYLTSANSDDTFTEHGIEILEETIKDCAIADGRCYLKRDSGKKILEKLLEPITYQGMLKYCLIRGMPLWKRSLHEQYGLFDTTYLISGDYAFWLKCMLHGEQVTVTNKVVGTLFLRRKSLFHSNLPTVKRELSRLSKIYGIHA